MNKNIETKNESEFLMLIPKLFSSQEDGYMLLFMEKTILGGSQAGELKVFDSFMELERATWNIDYTKSYLALIKDQNLAQITFSGQNQVISFRLQDGTPKLVFYKNKEKKPAPELIYQKDKDDILDEFEKLFNSKVS